MALNELLIISIQTRLKGSLLIGHRKQEPLLVLHNCPRASPARLLRGARWGDALGRCVPLRGVGHPSGGTVCLSGVVRAGPGLYAHVRGCVVPSGVVCSGQGLCMRVWGSI